MRQGNPVFIVDLGNYYLAEGLRYSACLHRAAGTGERSRYFAAQSKDGITWALRLRCKNRISAQRENKSLEKMICYKMKQ
jgi:hypothetical protein